MGQESSRHKGATTLGIDLSHEENWNCPGTIREIIQTMNPCFPGPKRQRAMMPTLLKKKDPARGQG
jgi:hypothetical protein